MLSKTKYAALCVLGAEIFYILCVGYGFILPQKSRELHHARFELIPGCAWENPVSIALGGLYMGGLALLGGWYIAWMHNVSLRVGR